MALEDLKPLIIWLHLHPHWGGVITFLVAFAECTAIIGLIVPGTIIMSAIGVLVGAKVLPLYSTVLWGIAGAYLGDLISYWLGYHYREYIRDLWPFRLVPHWFAKGELLFKRHGGKAIILGRFIGPIRPILPVLAGMMNMRPVTFLTLDAIAAAAWAPVYMLPGILIGTASLTLSPQMTTRLVIYSILVLLLLWLLYWLIKQILHRSLRGMDNVFMQVWQWLQTKPSFTPVRKLLANTQQDAPSQFILLIFCVIFFILFIFITANVIAHTNLLTANIAYFHYMRSVYSPTLHNLMVGITLFGDQRLMIVLWLIVFAWLAWRRYWVAAAHWLTIGFITVGLTGIFQRAIPSPRPPGVPHFPESWSYPSGHTSLSITFYGFLAFLVTHRRSLLSHCAVYSCVGIFILLIGFSRLYLGVHWLTDVLGGMCMGITILLGIIISYRRMSPPAIPLSGILTVAFTVILLGWSFLYIFYFERLVHQYTPHWPAQVISSTKWLEKSLEGQPIYLTNNFGIATQTINIQWAESLALIEQLLSNQGWKKKNPDKFLATLEYLKSYDDRYLFPYGSMYYEDRPPVLVMEKETNKSPLILRLWDSHTRVSGSHTPIWVGSLNYKPNRRYFFNSLQRNKQPQPNQAFPVIQQFIPYLSNTTWKILYYPTFYRLNAQEDLNWVGQLLLIHEPGSMSPAQNMP